MAKILDLEELACLARDLNVEIGHEMRSIEAITQTIANRLAVQMKVRAGTADMQIGFGGLCAPFYPLTADQEMPEALENYDHGGDWEFPHGGTPAEKESAHA